MYFILYKLMFLRRICILYCNQLSRVTTRDQESTCSRPNLQTFELTRLKTDLEIHSFRPSWPRVDKLNVICKKAVLQQLVIFI